MSLLALFVSFFPPSSIPASEDRTYQVILLISFIVTLLLPFILYELHDKRGKEAQIDEPVHMKTGDVNPGGIIMLYGKENREEADYLEPIFGAVCEGEDLPKYKLNPQSVEPRMAYQLVQDQLLDEGNARLNLATFCQTYMEPEAVKLMTQTLEKNAIDKSEYPRTAEIENRCVNIIADLWHASKEEKFMGTSTIGSSEACMLGGMAMKFAWRNRAEKLKRLSSLLGKILCLLGYRNESSPYG